MGTLLNWIDTMFFGIRRLFDGADAELPERPAVKFAGACSVVDDPANNRTVITVGGLIPDQGGGFTIGTAAGGWVTVQSDGNGFRVYNDDESDFAFEVDNNNGVTRSRWMIEAQGGVFLDDAQGAQPAPASGAYLYALAGALRVAQHAPPVVTGSRGGNAALTSLLGVLANAGLIVNQTTP